MTQKKGSLQLNCFLLSTLLVVTAIATVDVRAEFVIEPGASCLSSSCHSDIADQGNTHVMAAQGQSCSVCHAVPDPTKHEFRFAAPGGELCLRCHAPITDGTNKHVPVAAGLCSVCHQVHRADHPAQLSSSLNTLCQTCHGQISRPAVRTSHLPAGRGQCVMCHDPHSSNFDKQLTRAVPDLCFTCHDQQQEDEDGRLLPSVKPLFDDDSLNQHPAFARGQCVLCHDPHASEQYRLQREPYPESLYTRFSPATYFCVNCHGTKTFTEARTLSETKFRNGNLNLHHRHVTRDKGRSCRACHHHHAAERDALILDSTSFGDRYIEITAFERTETGGMCEATCHRSMRYDRLTPVENGLMVTAREGVDATLEELNREPPPIDGAAVYEKRCLGCHGVDAGGKIGPAIGGASAEEISVAVNIYPMMWVLRTLTAAEIEAAAHYLSSRRFAASVATALDAKTLFNTICAACHGADAKGGLAGTAPEIVRASSEKIELAVSRVALMQVLAALSAAEIQSIADFLSGDPFTSPLAAEGAAAREGDELFTTVCAACHGADAKGGLGPEIIGASNEDIKLAIGSVPMMNVLAELSAAEIQGVVDFLSSDAFASPTSGEVATVMEQIDGTGLYAARCAPCHGADANGGLAGMAPEIIGASSERIELAIGQVTLMQGVSDLTEHEIIGIAAYLQGKNTR